MVECAAYARKMKASDSVYTRDLNIKDVSHVGDLDQITEETNEWWTLEMDSGDVDSNWICEELS